MQRYLVSISNYKIPLTPFSLSYPALFSPRFPVLDRPDFSAFSSNQCLPLPICRLCPLADSSHCINCSIVKDSVLSDSAATTALAPALFPLPSPRQHRNTETMVGGGDRAAQNYGLQLSLSPLTAGRLTATSPSASRSSSSSSCAQTDCAEFFRLICSSGGAPLSWHCRHSSGSLKPISPSPFLLASLGYSSF